MRLSATDTSFNLQEKTEETDTAINLQENIEETHYQLSIYIEREEETVVSFCFRK